MRPRIPRAGAECWPVAATCDRAKLAVCGGCVVAVSEPGGRTEAAEGATGALNAGSPE